MMKKFNLSAASKALLTAGLLSLAMTGCSGDDGKNGEDGKPGPVGSPIGEVSQVKADITSASVSEDGFLTVNFNLADANGAAVFGLQQNDIGAVSFGRMGNEDEVGTTDIEGLPRNIWLSYFNKDKKDGFYTGSSYFQGKDCQDCLTDNGDGSYTLTLNKAIDTLGKYAYDAKAITGLYLGVKSANDAGSTLVDNSFFYWQPSSDTKQDKPKAMIADTTCQSCHRPGHAGELKMHGDKHITLESCTFCHTDYNSYPSKADPSKIVDGSIKALAHNIHSHSVYDPTGIYPQSSSNCLTCHQPDDKLAQVHEWKADLDAATCLSCHNAYSVPEWHLDDNSQIAEDKKNCVSCHSAETKGYRGAERGHYSENANNLSTAYKVTFDKVTVADDKSNVVVLMSVKDGDELVPLSQIDPRDYKYGGKNSAVVINGVKGDDFLINYNKVGVAAPGFGTQKQYAVQLESGQIEVTIPASDFDLDKVLVEETKIALSSQLHVCFNPQGVRAECQVVESNGTAVLGDIAWFGGEPVGDSIQIDPSHPQKAPYLVSDTFYFDQEGKPLTTETPRVQHVEMSACQDCHTTAITHRYTNDIDGCASCHNGTRDRGTGSSNLAYIVHGKHYLSESTHYEEGFFKKTDCQACHGETGFSLKEVANKATAPVAFGTTDGERLSDTNEQTVVSPQAAACVSCHTKPYALDDSAIAHMKSFGAVIAVTQFGEGYDAKFAIGVPASEYDAEALAQGGESCATCHTNEKIIEAHSNWTFPQW
ncbi:OmcA/MtrC family decaheme c-type cytochrome [Shewanella sp. 125m-1]